MTNIGSDLHAGATILVTGIPELNRKLRAAGSDLESMRDLMHKLGNIVVSNARPPVLSGELASTLRAGRGRTKAVVRAGYKRRAPYAGVRHYGDPHRPGHKPYPYLTDALRASQGQVVAELAKGIDRILITNGL